MAFDRTKVKTIDRNYGQGSAADLQDCIYLIPMSGIGTIGAMDAATRTISTITLNSGEKWERIFIERTANSYDSGREGNHYNHKVEAVVERLSGEKSANFANYRKTDMAVVFVDNNGEKRLMTSAMIASNESTATTNGYKIEITNGKTPDTLPYYSGPLPLV